MKILFNKPLITQNEIAAAVKVLKSKKIVGDGPIGQSLEDFIESLFNIRSVFLTTSCTHALEMALSALGIKQNEEVIMPSFGFVSIANAVAKLGAKPIFVDIEKNFLNIDPVKIEQAITKRTRAVICVHYAGMGCAMKEILKIGKDYKLSIIEDAAQAVGSKYDGKYLGTIGDIGCFSFHETKNLTCGEGGAFLTNNKKIAEKAEIIREKGTNRSQFIRFKLDKYTWLDLGSSYVLSDILAAILFEQFKKLEFIISRRSKIGLMYLEGLRQLEQKGKIILPKLQAGNDFNWHIFYFRVSSEKERDYALKKLKKKGIGATFHFVPLHLSPYAMKEYGYKKGDFPVTEKISATLIRLPIYPDLSSSDQGYVIDSLNEML